MVSMFSSGALRQQQGDFSANKPLIDKSTDMNMSDHNPYEEVIVINVAGKKFATYEKTLQKFPKSLLGDPDRRKAYVHPTTGECFFDRHRGAFEAILFYYQSNGSVIRPPPNIPVHYFIKECEFYDIGDETIEQLRVDNGLKEAEVEIDLPEWRPQRIVWNFLEFPDTSLAAKLFAIASVTIITLSLIMFVMESLPQFSPTAVEKDGKTIYIPSRHAKWMFLVNTVIIGWFTVEFVLRLLACPKKIKFFTTALNLIDLLSILPYYISLSIPEDDANSLSVLRVVRVIRVLRVFKLSRHSRGLQILGNTLKASVNELFMLAFFLFVVILIFGSCVYYAEYEVKGTKFKSIPSSFWWAIVTMTTVGYGDMTPQTFWGQIVGGMAVVCGVLTIALPVPVVVSNFEHFYTRDRNRRKMEEARKDQEKQTEQQKNNSNPSGRKLSKKFSRRLKGSTHGDSKKNNDVEKGNSDHSKLNGEAVIVDIPEWNQYTTAL